MMTRDGTSLAEERRPDANRTHGSMLAAAHDELREYGCASADGIAARSHLTWRRSTIDFAHREARCSSRPQAGLPDIRAQERNADYEGQMAAIKKLGGWLIVMGSGALARAPSRRRQSRARELVTARSPGRCWTPALRAVRPSVRWLRRSWNAPAGRAAPG